MKNKIGFIFCCILYCISTHSQNNLQIESSNRELVDAFTWAKQKANSYVQTGKQGPIDISESNSQSAMVDYIPSYWAGYPLRTAFYSRDFCHQALGAHLIDLHEENFTMLKAFAASANKERKWYPLWAMNFDGSPYKLDYRSDSNFVREVPATFELVEKAYLLYSWTKDKRYLEDEVLWNYYTKVVTEFITLHDSFIPNGVAESSGTGSIFKGTATYNEQRGIVLLEAGDGIAAQYKALLSYAKMASLRNKKSLAKEYFAKAEKLKEYFNTDWGVKNTTMYNRGYDNTSQPIDGWGKENSWFMPMKGIIDASSTRTSNYLSFINERLESNDDIPENIEAISYIPETFFIYSENDRGWKWMKHIIQTIDQVHSQSTLTGSNGNYPEVSYVLISNIVENLAGVEPIDNNIVVTASHLTDEIKDLEIKNILIGKSQLTVKHLGLTSSTCTHTMGKTPIIWRAKFKGDFKYLYVNGKRKSTKQSVDYGQAYSYVDIELKTNQSATVYTTLN